MKLKVDIGGGEGCRSCFGVEKAGQQGLLWSGGGRGCCGVEEGRTAWSAVGWRRGGQQELLWGGAGQDNLLALCRLELKIL